MDQSPRLTADLYVRADAPISEQRSELLDTLDRLQRERRLAEFAVHPWPNAVSLDLVEAAAEDSIAGVVRSFERWAGDRGVSIRPPFAVRRSHSEITGETDELLVLPVVCLAAYDGEELVGVYPCCTGGSTVTVADALATIEAGGADLLRPSPDAESSPAGEEPLVPRRG
jgi:hypothetical protein